MSRTDALGYTTSYGYADGEIPGCGAGGSGRYAHVTKVTPPSADGGVMEEKYCWDTYIGGLLQRKDANLQSTSYEFETDAGKLDRLARVTLADGAVTEYAYCDTPGSACSWPAAGGSLPGNTVGTSRSYVAGLLKGWVQYDGLGRTTETRQKGTRDIVSERTYDGMGRAERVSAAHYGDEGAAWTKATWDTLGRLTNQRNEYDSSEQRWSPGTIYTVFTDESRSAGLTAGERRKEQRDARGRLVAVWEDEGNANTITSYRHDALDRLIGACMGGTFDTAGQCTGAGSQGRSFVYDALGG